MGVKELKFDAKKVKKVSIDDIRVNSWNPKEVGTEEYKMIVKSVDTNGLRDFIIVRTNPDENTTYEIIDGQQRFTAAKDLAYTEVFVYDEGEVSDKIAQELTVWYQEQVPFDKVAEAFFVSGMIDKYGIEQLNLPYSEQEYKDMADLAKFDFNQYDAKGGDGSNQENNDIRTIAIKVEKDKYDFIMNTIHQVSESEDCNEGRALELICADYFSSGKIVEDNNS